MLQMWFLGIYMVTQNSYLNELLTRKSHEFLESQVQDPQLRELLRPDFKYFCKRPLFLDNLYPALCKENCKVVRENLKQYTETGILSSNSKTRDEYSRDFDVILFATGFNLAQYLQHETVTGHKGADLQTQWQTAPSGIYGLATANFPNFFYVNGPNANTFSSIHHEMNEVLADYLCRLLAQIKQRSAGASKVAIMPTLQFEQDWNSQLQQKISHIVVQDPACNSYQKTAGGKNTIIHHLHIWQLWWRLRTINWSEWTVLRQKGEYKDF